MNYGSRLSTCKVRSHRLVSITVQYRWICLVRSDDIAAFSTCSCPRNCQLRAPLRAPLSGQRRCRPRSQDLLLSNFTHGLAAAAQCLTEWAVRSQHATRITPCPNSRIHEARPPRVQRSIPRRSKRIVSQRTRHEPRTVSSGGALWQLMPVFVS